jgi:hypothetical protein
VGINEDVYGGALFVMAGLSLQLFTAAGILLGLAASRTRVLPRWAGFAFAASAVLFVLSFFLFDVVQPVGGLGIGFASIGFAVAARRSAVGDAGLRSARRLA